MHSTRPITLKSGANEITACRHGAQLLSWCYHGQEQLWLSATADLSGQSAIRGGVPLCFPWFGRLEPGPSHGFARTSSWQLVLSDAPAGVLEFALTDTPQSRAIWPYRFRATLQIQCEEAGLSLTLDVENRDARPWPFTAALHSYFACRDVEQIQLPALAGIPYQDKLTGTLRQFQPGPLPLPIDAVVPDLDRLVIENTVVQSEGGDAMVIWNPGAEGAAGLADMETEQWRRFLCVESAIACNPVTLAPGQRHRLCQTIRPGTPRAGEPA